jgi:hypothetical protein
MLETEEPKRRRPIIDRAMLFGPSSLSATIRRDATGENVKERVLYAEERHRLSDVSKSLHAYHRSACSFGRNGNVRGGGSRLPHCAFEIERVSKYRLEAGSREFDGTLRKDQSRFV